MSDPIVLVGLLASLSVGVLTVTGALGAAAWSRNRTLIQRLAQHAAPHLSPDDFSDLDARVERLVGRTRFGRGLLRDLRQLGVRFRPGRLIVYGFILAAVGYGLVAVKTGSSIPGLIAFAGLVAGEFAFARWRAGQRWNDYRLQLPEALHVVASALAAGASLNQALKHSAREIQPPLQWELQRLVEDVEVGKTLEEATADLKARVPLPEFDMVIASLLIQQRSGGNLGELLKETAHLIKQNEELRQEMNVLTSQAKASARLVALLPVGLFVYLLMTNRPFLEPLLDTRIGNAMLGLAGTMAIVGYWAAMRVATFSEGEE